MSNTGKKPDWQVLEEAKQSVIQAARVVERWDRAKAEAWLPGLQDALAAYYALRPGQPSELLSAV